MSFLWKICLCVFTILTLIDNPLAQTEQGDQEISVSAFFIYQKLEGGEGTALSISTSYGYFASKNFEVGPEISYSDQKGGVPGFVIVGNLTYNFNPIGKGAIKVPFVFAGLGYSNSTDYVPRMSAPSSVDDANWKVANLGAGFKIFLPKPVALRLEYRYQNFFRYQRLVGNVNYAYHYLSLGISMFL